MPYKLVVAPQAMLDIDKIGTYIREDLKAPEAAKALIARILNAVGRLKDFPFSGEKIKFTYIPDCNVRRVIVENYIVLYRAEELNDTVSVLRILYGGTDYLNYLKFE